MRKRMPLLIYAFLVALVPYPGRAQNILTLTLETPGLEARVAQQSPSHSQQSVVSQTSSAAAQNAKSSSVGRIGMVTLSNANIYAHRDNKSKVFSKCPKEASLAVVAEIGEWYGVLMVDGSTGWIAKKNVKLLDYQLVQEKIAAARSGALTSRGNTDRSRLAASANGQQIVQEAYRYLGVPYVWGGTSNNGLDCSGFVQKVNASCGVQLPRTSRSQAEVGEMVSYDNLMPGDRLYFACKGSVVDHCGIYIGNNLFIHSSAGRRGVDIDDLRSTYWSQTLVVARR